MTVHVTLHYPLIPPVTLQSAHAVMGHTILALVDWICHHWHCFLCWRSIQFFIPRITQFLFHPVCCKGKLLSIHCTGYRTRMLCMQKTYHWHCDSDKRNLVFTQNKGGVSKVMCKYMLCIRRTCTVVEFLAWPVFQHSSDTSLCWVD